MNPPMTISPNQLDQLRRQGQRVKLLDVRTPAEFHRVHADLAVNVPLNRLDSENVARNCRANEPVYIIGWKEQRERQACERLRALGCANVVQVEGGTEAWESAGLPVVHDPNPI